MEIPDFYVYFFLHIPLPFTLTSFPEREWYSDFHFVTNKHNSWTWYWRTSDYHILPSIQTTLGMINIKKIEDEVKTSVTVERELTIVFKVVEFFVIWLILWYVNMKYLISKHFCHCDFWSVRYRKICINNILDFANISNISNSQTVLLFFSLFSYFKLISLWLNFFYCAKRKEFQKYFIEIDPF